MRDIGLLSRVVPLLQHDNVKLLTRAVGVCHPRAASLPRHHEVCALQVVHNMSSDSSSIASIRHEQALPMLIHLLKVDHFACVLVVVILRQWRALSDATRRHRSSPYAEAPQALFKTCQGSTFHATSSGAVLHCASAPRYLSQHSCRRFLHFFLYLHCFAHSKSARADPPEFLLRCSGIEPLIDLLFGSDIASQVRAPNAACGMLCGSRAAGLRQWRPFELHRPVAVTSLRASAQEGAA
jgi:hypothetical protein